MTNAQLEAIYLSATSQSHVAGLKAVFNAGYYAKAGITPDTFTAEISGTQAAPTAYVKIKKPD